MKKKFLNKLVTAMKKVANSLSEDARAQWDEMVAAVEALEADDTEHRRDLDLLMMVQGWRRYDYEELTDTIPLRYEPETALMVTGCV